MDEGFPKVAAIKYRLVVYEKPTPNKANSANAKNRSADFAALQIANYVYVKNLPFQKYRYCKLKRNKFCLFY